MVVKFLRCSLFQFVRYFFVFFRRHRHSFGTLWDLLGFLWRSRVTLLGAFGSSGLSLGSLWYVFVTQGRKGGL